LIRENHGTQILALDQMNRTGKYAIKEARFPVSARDSRFLQLGKFFGVSESDIDWFYEGYSCGSLKLAQSKTDTKISGKKLDALNAGIAARKLNRAA